MDAVDTDVIVIGAGLAGLRCAADLQRTGLDVQVLEASDEVGGRVRTDRVDGFRCDRGFQVLNPAYPALRDSVDLGALGLQGFAPGVGVLSDRGRGRSIVADPLRRPSLLLDTLLSGAVGPSQVAGALRWLIGPGPDTPDMPRAVSMDEARFHGPLRTEVIERFLAGVVLETDGSSSARYVRDLARLFLAGTPGVPSLGMGALPRRLAEPLGASVHLGARVERIGRDGGAATVQVEGHVLRSRQVVVAAGPRSTSDLATLPEVAMKGVTTWWFAPEERPTGVDLLLVDSRHRAGPLANTAVLSNVAPSYAPPGRHLVQASAVGVGLAAEETAIRRQLSDLYAADAFAWPLLVRHDVADALPTEPAGRRAGRPQDVDDLTVAAGDVEGGASIQGALDSGARAAELVALRLGTAATTS